MLRAIKSIEKTIDQKAFNPWVPQHIHFSSFQFYPPLSPRFSTLEKKKKLGSYRSKKRVDK